MSETYFINFSDYENNPYFLGGTATLDRITFYSTNSNNLNNKKNDEE